eukprot:2180846-Rhodomonas_salina.2
MRTRGPVSGTDLSSVWCYQSLSGTDLDHVATSTVTPGPPRSHTRSAASTPSWDKAYAVVQTVRSCTDFAAIGSTHVLCHAPY